MDAALAVGVGGFIVFGGEAEAVRALTAELRERAARPLLIGADLERGAGQQFSGATSLPPVAALGHVDDLGVTYRAAALTAREARALGVSWIYAPVADLDVEPRNPIVGTRAFGSDAARVALHVQAWVRGCHAGGALCCVKHFPGHGRTTSDSHLGLPRVDASRRSLEADLAPFAAGFAMGADAVMSAHVAYPALDAAGGPATLSRPILTDLLRAELRFHGLAVTDALIMEGVSAARSADDGSDGRASGGDSDARAATEGEVAVRAVAAGCDALLYPRDLERAADALARAAGTAALPAARVDEALARLDAALQRAEALAAGAVATVAATAAPAAETAAAASSAGEAGERDDREWGGAADRAWALDVARGSLVAVRGAAASLPEGEIEVYTVDDDVGGPYPPPARQAFPDALREAGRTVREADPPGVVSADRAPAAPAPPETASLTAPAASVVALYADIRGWKGRPGVSARARDAVRRVLEARPDATVVLFGHPRLAADVPGARVLAAWGGEALMQRAAAVALTERGEAEPS